MAGLKMTEILVILLIVMLLFGATRLPALGSSLGSAIRNFKRGFSGDDEGKVEADKKLAGTGGVVSSDQQKARENEKG